MSQEQPKTQRTYINTTYTPVYAKNIAALAIQAAEANTEGITYQLIIARVFTAFMMEGVVDYLGRILVSDWDEKKEGTDKKKIRTRSSFIEKHKFVRKTVGLSNHGTDFETLQQNRLNPLFDFRHKFAHPKHETEKIDGAIKNINDDFQPAAWAGTLSLEGVKQEFESLTKYCKQLNEKTVDYLEKEKQNHTAFCKKFPHLVEDADDQIKELSLSLYLMSLGRNVDYIQ